VDEASSGQVSTQVGGAALRQAGAALGRMAGRAAVQAGKALWRWALVTIGPWVGLVLVLALLHGSGGQEQVADVSAARAAVRASVQVRSVDSEELQFLLPPTLVSVIARLPARRPGYLADFVTAGGD